MRMNHEPRFPYLEEHDYFEFPAAEEGTPEGIVGVGGNLSPGMLLSAYYQGVFPWYSAHDPILWWNPDPRFVLDPARLHVPRRLARLLRKDPFSYTLDSRFSAVVEACRTVPRAGQDGTWITDEVLHGYNELHRLGYAHSLEVLLDGELVGGLYGVAIGRLFFGESMFSLVGNASKAGFVRLVELLRRDGYRLIDCQVYTAHLDRLGAFEMPRALFLQRLRQLRSQASAGSSWSRTPIST